MKHYHLIPLLLLSLLACCCGGDKKAVQGFEQAPIAIEHKDLDTSLYMNHPLSMTFKKGTLIVSHIQTDIGHTTAFELDPFRNLGSFGLMGRGPKEVIAAFKSATPRNDEFAYYDPIQRCVLAYRVTQDGGRYAFEPYEKKTIQNIEGMSYSLTRVSKWGDKHYVGLALIADSSKFFALLDDSLKLVDFFGDGPVKERPSNTMDRLQGNVCTFDSLMFYHSFDLPYVSCYVLRDGRPIKKWEDTFTESFYTIKGGQILFSKEKTIGRAKTFYISPNYVYLLWFDRLASEYSESKAETSAAKIVYVFDHSGRRITKLQSDVLLSSIGVSDDERTMYAIANNDGEFSLVSFDLPQF